MAQSLGTVKEIDLSDLMGGSGGNGMTSTTSTFSNNNVPITVSNPMINPISSQSFRTIPFNGLELLSNKPASPVTTQTNSFNVQNIVPNPSQKPSQQQQYPQQQQYQPQIQLQRQPTNESNQARVSGFENIVGTNSVRDLSDILNSDTQRSNVPIEKIQSNPYLVPTMEVSKGPSTFQTTTPSFNSFSSNLGAKAASIDPIGSGYQPQATQQPNQPTSTSLSFNEAHQQTQAQPVPPTPMTEEQIQKEKQDLLFKLQRLAQKGVPVTRRYTMNHSLAEIKDEYLRLKAQRDVDISVKFQKKMMMAFVTGVEFLNSKFDPFDVKLDGWSESVHESSDDYDEIFEELHEKYKDRAKIAPEIRLMMQLAGSAFMYHMMQSYFKTSFPGMETVMKDNPDLARKVGQAAATSAAANSSNPGFGNFMSNILSGFGGMSGSLGGGSAGGGPNTRVASDRSTGSAEGFRGPSGVDNILNSLNVSSRGAAAAPVQGDQVRQVDVQRRSTKTPSFNKGISLNL